MRRSSRILWRVRWGERAQGILWAWEHSTPTRQLCVGYCEKAFEGKVTTDGKYMLQVVLECLRYLLLAGLKL